MSKIWQMGAVQLAQYIRELKLSSREVVGPQLRRIERVNPRLNAVTVVLAQEALVGWPAV